jgi:hypothetical protein
VCFAVTCLHDQLLWAIRSEASARQIISAGLGRGRPCFCHGLLHWELGGMSIAIGSRAALHRIYHYRDKARMYVFCCRVNAPAQLKASPEDRERRPVRLVLRTRACLVERLPAWWEGNQSQHVPVITNIWQPWSKGSISQGSRTRVTGHYPPGVGKQSSPMLHATTIDLLSFTVLRQYRDPAYNTP